MSKQQKRKEPSSAHIQQVRERTVDVLVGEARAKGASVSRSLDADYGATRPAEAWVVDRVAAAEVAGLLPDFHERSACEEAALHLRGPEMVSARARRDEALKARDAAAKAQKQAAKKLSGGEKHYRFAGPGAALFGKAVMLGLGVGDVALAKLIFEMLGIPTLSTWLIASVVGVCQLIVLHHLGEMSAAPAPAHDPQSGARRLTKRFSRRGLLLLAIAVPVLALALLMAWLRADYLALQTADLGGGSVSWGIAMATFCAIQLVLDSLAFIVGYRGGAPAVKAALASRGAARRKERAYRGARRRADRSEAIFGAAYAAALGCCDSTTATAIKAWSERRAGSAAFYGGICNAADPQTAAVFSEAAQLEGVDEESLARVTVTLEAIEERRAELLAWAVAYGFTKSARTAPAVERETAAADRPAGGNGKPAQPPKIVIQKGASHAD